MGEAAPAVRAQLDIESPLFVLELEIDEAIARGKGEQPAPSRFPPLERDLSLIVPEDIRYEQVEEAIRRKGGGLLADLVLFDLYRGGQIPSGRRGLSFRLVFRSPERTLEDEEVNGIIEETLDYLRKELNIGLR
jgi:phenylalanyl-tRNA synthetase beta chain